MDLNEDGFVTQGEVRESRKKRFDNLDTDNSGELSQAELEGRRRGRRAGAGRRAARRAARRFARRDKDNNGTLSFDEFSGDISRLMERADSNEDGKISRAEWDAMHQSRRGRRRQRRGNIGSRL
jgi:Ca2+-binding EF-hand superfamily protein